MCKNLRNSTKVPCIQMGYNTRPASESVSFFLVALGKLDAKIRPGAAPQRVVGQSATPCAGGSARLYGRACQSDICI